MWLFIRSWSSKYNFSKKLCKTLNNKTIMISLGMQDLHASKGKNDIIDISV